MEEDYQYHGFKGSGELPCSEETKKMLARVSSDDHRIHVCDLCNKEFSSGKALSGHRRIHSHQPSDHPNKKIKNQVHASSSSSSSSVEGLNYGDGEYQCSCCAKKFSSVKSLSGHMRYHPDRNWKGIRPPQLLLAPPRSSPPPTRPSPATTSVPSSLAPISPQEEEGDDKDLDSLTAHEEEEEKEDGDHISSPTATMGPALPKWSKTGMRGRKSLVIGPPEVKPDNSTLLTRLLCPTLQAADNLMSLVQRTYQDGLHVDQIDGIKVGFDQESLDVKHEGGILNHNMETNEKMNWKPRESAVEAQIEKKIKKIFKCSTCSKSFSTFQALGGHRSSHHKDKTSTPTRTVKVKETREFREHQCNVCSKTFPTGQALGGHKKRHRGGPLPGEVVADDSQTAGAIVPLPLPEEATETDAKVKELATKTSVAKVLDFDLNCPYVMEEEEEED